jgi:uracil-DNA glycosylase family 4
VLENVHADILRCRACPRLVAWREAVAEQRRAAFRDETYWGKPVPGFGDPAAPVVIVGLAPAAHGANRTGRMFTGDRSGDFLVGSLHRTGFASQPTSVCASDGLELIGCYLTAVVKCAPPANRPTGEEEATCRRWLLAELFALPTTVVAVALGQTAFRGLLRAGPSMGWGTIRRARFSHGAEAAFPTGPHLIASYHPSQQNTFTGRLTPEMLDEVFGRAARRAWP